VVVAEERDIPLETTYTGRVDAVHTVELRPRVGGALDKVLFREGTAVRQGTPLFRIDERPYAIALRRAEADAATVDAQLARAREELQRAERLAAADAVSVEELERRRAEVGMLDGRLASARAAVQDASLNLEFTTVHAPVDGRIGRAEVTEGNLVDGGPGTGTRLAVLRSIDPVYVYFELDPATAAAATRHQRSAWRASVSPLDGGAALAGPIDFVDNGVGLQTGTLKVRARLANPDGRLLPGSVVKVAFRYGMAERATVVPELAIGTDQGARYVLVAGADGTVEYRPVSLGAKSGAWRVVNESVRAGDQVVLPGLPGLRPGMKVNAVEEVVR
jgi:RND family efflux transporter MFP subunit